MNYRIHFKVTNELDEIEVAGSTYLNPPLTESAEMEFWKVMRGFENRLKEIAKEKDLENEEEQDRLDDIQENTDSLEDKLKAI